MEKLKQIRKLRKGWKIFIAAMLALIVFGGVGMYVAASSNVKITMSVSGLTVYKGKTSKTLYASLSGTDENAQESVPVPERLEWSTSNSQIADFATGTEDNPVYMDSVTGLAPVIHGNFAGKATITANYYTKKFDEDNNEIVGSRELLDTRKATVTVPLSVTVTYNGSESIPNYLEVGSQLYITTNASDANRIVIETSNDKTGTVSSDGVVKLVQSTGSTATLEVVGGGTTTVYVRTTDNPEKEDALVKIFKVTGKIHFLDGQGNANDQDHFIQTSSITPSNGVKRYMVLDKTEYKDFMQEEKYSNVILDTHQYLMVAEANGCEQTVEAYVKYVKEELEPKIEEMEKYFPVICGEWCLFNSLACGCDTKGGQSVLNGVEGSQQESLSPEEKKEIYETLAKAQLELWEKGSGYFYWSYKLLTDTVNTPGWIGWDSWDMGRCYDFGWFPADKGGC